MPDTYLFIGQATRTYPDVVLADGTVLVASPGDEIVLDSPPNDGNWVDLTTGTLVAVALDGDGAPKAPAKPAKAPAKES